MNNTKNASMITLMALMESGGRHYAIVAPATWLKLLKRKHSIEIGKSWMHEALKGLENEGFITRQRRWVRKTRRYFKRKGGRTRNERIEPSQIKHGEIRSDPSGWAFTAKGANYLISKCVVGAKALLNKIIIWYQRGDKRWPRGVALFQNGEVDARKEGLTKIGALFRPIDDKTI